MEACRLDRSLLVTAPLRVVCYGDCVVCCGCKGSILNVSHGRAGIASNNGGWSNTEACIRKTGSGGGNKDVQVKVLH